ncbi:mu1 adaptin [Stylonychia lemnae]|uniref:Mu1 adaptin n=1 Tax=Stylonychia lemnae TaxID=5949 RepID=A0A078AA68_STYLE|nr:mu1 adaptin [Stylonychia lemnae]|eukprot:CDW78452.1 mu1 adaptin [Stylonychia lemnae]
MSGLGCSAIYFLDQKGKIIISRDYRGEVGSNITEKFQRKVLELDDRLVKPVFTEKDITYMWIRVNNIYIVAVAKGNPNVALVFSFLYRMQEVFTDYFKELEDESLRDNFVITYELLDEMMDHGYPQITEVKILKEYIKTEANKIAKEQKISQAKLSTAVTNVVSWRPDGIKHPKNEIFLDVIEKLNLLVSANGNVLRSEILGTVRMKSFLSGMPELKLGLNDKVLFEMTGRTSRGKLIELEDIKFHQCVRLNKFETERNISFIPPDGEFELMTYRLDTQVKPLIWVECIVESFSRSKIEYLVKAKTQFKSKSIANNVEIFVSVPSDVDSPVFKSNVGTVKYVPDQNCMVWCIKQFQGRKEFLMRAQFGFPSVEAEERQKYSRVPIQVKFEIPYFTVSGIQVRYLKIVEKSGYQALPWVRYITQNGDYQIRMN